MNGTAHTAIGAASGFVVANSLNTDPTTTVYLVGLGSVSGLVPDLDIDGKLSGRITFSHKVIRTVAQLMGIVLFFYSYYEGTGIDQYVGMGIGLAITGVASSIRQKHMLTTTGIGVMIGGYFLDETWIILMGVYIMLASLMAHRTYTHSIVGVLFYAVIVSQLEASLSMNGVFYTGLIGYISHLVADSKILPFNRRGVKLLLPFSSTEF